MSGVCTSAKRLYVIDINKFEYSYGTLSAGTKETLSEHINEHLEVRGSGCFWEILIGGFWYHIATKRQTNLHHF